MNLWLRLIYVLFSSWRSTPLSRVADVSICRGRVWPNDLDTSLHMNNGRYLTLLDHGRTDWTIRTGLLRATLKNGWLPVVTTATARFVREMRLWTRYRLETRVAGWIDTQVFFEQRIYIDSGSKAGSLAFLAIVKAGLYDRKARAFVPTSDLFALTGMDGEQPELRADLKAFLDAEEHINAVSKGSS